VSIGHTSVTARALACAARLAAIGLGSLLCLGARAQTAGEWRSSEQLWRDTCAYCHNDHLAPELRGTALTAQAITGAVRLGPRAMPSFPTDQISDAELDALAGWLARSKRPPPPEDSTDRAPRHANRDRSR